MCEIDCGPDMDQFQAGLREMVDALTQAHQPDGETEPDLDEMARDLHERGGAVMWAAVRLLANSMFAANGFKIVRISDPDYEKTLRANRLVVQELANNLFMMAVNGIVAEIEAQEAAADAEG